MDILKQLLLYFLFGQVKTLVSDVEVDIFLSMAKAIYIKNCVFAPNVVPDTRAVEIVKKLSKEQIFTVFQERKNLKNFLENISKTINYWMAVILKEQTRIPLDYFSNKDIIPLYFWLLFDTSNGTLYRELTSTDIPHNSAVFFIEKVTTDYYKIFEYYQIKKNTPAVTELVCEWKNNGLTMGTKRWYDRKGDMRQYEFTTVKFNESLYLNPKEKVNEALWEELSQLLNFTIKLKVIHYTPNFEQKFNLGEENEVLLDTQIYIGDGDKNRSLLGPTSRSGLYMHIKAGAEYRGFKRILKPFSNQAWLSIAQWICYCGFVKFLVEYLLKRFGCSKKSEMDLLLNILLPLDSICNQSGVETSSNLSSRLVLFFIRSSASVINSSYAAIFISCLLLYIPQLPFTDLKGFVEDGSYKIVGERNSEIDTYFRVSGEPLERLVYEKYLYDVTKWSRLDKEVNRLCEGEKLVLIAYDDDIDKYRPCNIIKIRKSLKFLVNGFKLRFKSPFARLLRIKLILLRTTGILGRIHDKILYQTHHRNNENKKYEISMERVLPIFQILTCGFMMSLGIFVLEVLFHKQRIFCYRSHKRARLACRGVENKTLKNGPETIPFCN